MPYTNQTETSIEIQAADGEIRCAWDVSGRLSIAVFGSAGYHGATLDGDAAFRLGEWLKASASQPALKLAQ